MSCRESAASPQRGPLTRMQYGTCSMAHGGAADVNSQLRQCPASRGARLNPSRGAGSTRGAATGGLLVTDSCGGWDVCCGIIQPHVTSALGRYSALVMLRQCPGRFNNGHVASCIAPLE